MTKGSAAHGLMANFPVVITMQYKILLYDISYKQAQMAVAEALPKLRKLGVPIERPSDYFAEMVKTDDHMQKVGSFSNHALDMYFSCLLGIFK